VTSLLAAAGLYWSETRSAEAPEAQVLVGYDRQRDHDLGVLYGSGGRDLVHALEAVDSPVGHAALTVGVGAMVAWICFYRARLVEEDERPERDC
jgi:hypothetical protein